MAVTTQLSGFSRRNHLPGGPSAFMLIHNAELMKANVFSAHPATSKLKGPGCEREQRPGRTRRPRGCACADACLPPRSRHKRLFRQPGDNPRRGSTPPAVTLRWLQRPPRGSGGASLIGWGERGKRRERGGKRRAGSRRPEPARRSPRRPHLFQ